MGNSNYNVDNFPDKEVKIKEDDSLKTKGSAGSIRKEPVPSLNAIGSEKVISQANSWIVLGKDRNGSPVSGYAGAGFTQASSIDMVVGRKNNLDGQPPAKDIAVDPDFFDDSARIYLTQKGDIDTYFGIVEGTENNLVTEKKSGIGIKADHVRLFGREHIKIVTGQSQNFGSKLDNNSLGESIGKVGRIDFIAGNYNDFVSNPSKLQPLVKGENLVELQKEIIQTLQEMTTEITRNTSEILSIYSMLGTIIAPTTAMSAAPAALGAFQAAMTAKLTYLASTVVPIQVGIQQGLVATQINYLEIVDGTQYINSEHVFTT